MIGTINPFVGPYVLFHCKFLYNHQEGSWYTFLVQDLDLIMLKKIANRKNIVLAILSKLYNYKRSILAFSASETPSHQLAIRYKLALAYHPGAYRNT